MNTSLPTDSQPAEPAGAIPAGVEAQGGAANDSPPIAAPAANRLIVHLVHGTWPDGPLLAACRRVRRSLPYPPVDGARLWFQTGHPFRKELKGALATMGFDVDVRPFLWSGFNSFRERAAAAEDLVGHLARGIFESARQIIIGHSHGGTVAMLALKLMSEGATPNTVTEGGSLFWLSWKRKSGHDSALDIKEVVKLSIEQVRRGAEDIELVTLATPFLRVEKFGSGRFLWSVFGFCWMTLICTVSVLVARRFGESAMGPVVFVAGLALALAAAAIGNARDFVQNRIVNKQANRFVGKRIQCIRGISDEANMGINLGIIGCNVIRTLLVLFGQPLNRISPLLVGIGYVTLLGVMVYAMFALDTDPILGGLYVAASAAGALIMLLAFASLLQAGLGIELAWAGLNFLTTVESSPDASRPQIEVVTLPATKDTAEGMRHAIYLHPDCIRKILDGVVS